MLYKKCGISINKIPRRWIAEINIYSELQNPLWLVNEQTAKKIIKKCRRLPYYISGIPRFRDTLNNGCKLAGTGYLVIHSYGSIVVIYDKNIIEIKEDTDFTVENEILKSAPEVVYKKIYFYI
jgi:hypothetical protein